MKLPEEMLTQYDVHTYEINNYISFAGFTTDRRLLTDTYAIGPLLRQLPSHPGFTSCTPLGRCSLCSPHSVY
jgi:hypothetical protein